MIAAEWNRSLSHRSALQAAASLRGGFTAVCPRTEVRYATPEPSRTGEVLRPSKQRPNLSLWRGVRSGLTGLCLPVPPWGEREDILFRQLCEVQGERVGQWRIVVVVAELVGQGGPVDGVIG